MARPQPPNSGTASPLTPPDIEIKQDRLFLEGGVGWWKQITDAIGSVEFLILLITPELEAKLTYSAAQQGRKPDELAQRVLTLEEESRSVEAVNAARMPWSAATI